ncbi:MAG: lytic transglycosylase domain-containing protein [Rhodospirillales bacterium]|nr:lytic transglycosylase domain-containing protein [Rhodospirillales bacterium]
MRRILLPVLILLGPAFVAAARAQPNALSSNPLQPSPMVLVRANDWAGARAAASAVGDPVAVKLVTFYRLLAPDQASAAEIAAFMARNPDWPLRYVLARRLDEALTNEPDAATAQRLCLARMPAQEGALQRCAEVLAPSGARPFIRAAWVALAGDPQAEAAFLARWGAALRPADQLARFDVLIRSDQIAARRQMTRLAPADAALAQARLALRTNAADAAARLAALGPAQARAPALLLDEAYWLRRNGHSLREAALLLGPGDAAEAADPALAGRFWWERARLARDAMQAGNAATAQALAADTHQVAADPATDADFLAGFIALRLRHDPAAARPFFVRLAAFSKAAITQGRAWYWIAQCDADPKARALDLARSAAWPETFYGQLAAAELGEDVGARIRAMRDPPVSAVRLNHLADRQLARAAAILVAWGAPRRAVPFLLRLDDTVPDATARVLTARLALGLGLAPAGVAIARRAGVQGVALVQSGWPVAAQIPPDAPVEPALALAIIRQESSFDAEIRSPSDALGLMQLLPGTAADEGRRLGILVRTAALTADPSLNIRLGTAYLASLLRRYDGALPLAIAAYNAGPGNVDKWLASQGDPRTGANGALSAGWIDWIESIPFAETRDYVQRVMESLVVYRALAGVSPDRPAVR